MARKRVVEYIRGLLQKGYDISTIKNTMVKYGYTEKDINEAINDVYNPTVRHEIHLGKTTLAAIFMIIISVAGIASFFYFSPPKAPAKLLDLSLEPIKTEVTAGESISFIQELSNKGSSSRFDVVVRQEIVDPKTFEVVTFKSETRAIETFTTTPTQIIIPEDTPAGSYILRVIVEYDGAKAPATLPIKVIQTKKESCFDGIKNQDEAEIDCGGICKECNEVVIDCNDNNPCTEDIEENGKCLNERIVPCCGNEICETGEGCETDCPKKDTTVEANPETLDGIKDLARTDPEKAAQLCGELEVPDIKDTCLSNIGEVQKSMEYCETISSTKIKDSCRSNIAKSIGDKTLCSEIKGDGIRDSCYANFFVPPNKDYSVCELITNKDLRASCHSLRQLDELHKGIQQ